MSAIAAFFKGNCIIKFVVVNNFSMFALILFLVGVFGVILNKWRVLD